MARPGGYRQVLAMAVPLILSTGSWSLQGFINRMFLVWHSPESLAAAMPAGMVNFAILSLFIATAGYVSTFVAQYHGSGQDGKVGGILWQSVPIALFAGLVNLALVPARTGLLRLGGACPGRSGRGSHPVSDPLPLRGAGGDGFRLFRNAFGSRAEHGRSW